MKVILTGVVAAIGATVSMVGWGASGGTVSRSTSEAASLAAAQQSRRVMELPPAAPASRVDAVETAPAPAPRLLAPLVPGRSLEERARAGAAKVGRDVWYFADWDGDGGLSGGDFLAYLAAYQGRESGADLNRDGVLDTADIAEFLRQYSEGRTRQTYAC